MSEETKATVDEQVSMVEAVAGEEGRNPAPAIETGPHLHDEATRKLKEMQLREAGFRANSKGLTEDMTSILERK